MQLPRNPKCQNLGNVSVDRYFFCRWCSLFGVHLTSRSRRIAYLFDHKHRLILLSDTGTMAEVDAQHRRTPIATEPPKKVDPFKNVPDLIEERRKESDGSITSHRFMKGALLGKVSDG